MTGGEGADAFALMAGDGTEFATDGAAVLIGDFQPGLDRIEVDYTGQSAPVLSLDTVAGGVVLRADGAEIAYLPGIEAGQVDLAAIRLVQVSA